MASRRLTPKQKREAEIWARREHEDHRRKASGEKRQRDKLEAALRVQTFVTPRSEMPASERRRYNYGSDLVGTFVQIDHDADWMISGAVIDAGGRLALERITVEPNLERHPDSAPTMTTNALRSVRLDALLGAVRRELLADPARIEWTVRNFPDLNSARVAKRALKNAETAARQVRPMKSTGRGRKLEDEFLWRLARDYLEVRDTASRAVNAELRKRYGTGGMAISSETMRDWLKACEKAGYLTAGHRGRASREAGPKFDQGETKHKEQHNGS